MRSGLKLMSQKSGNECRIGFLNGNIVRIHNSVPLALGPLYNADSPQGKKIRQQRESENLEIVVPPSFPSPYTVDARSSTAEFEASVRSFGSQDNRFGLPLQSHDAYRAFEATNSQDTLPLEHDVSGTMGHYVQPEPYGLPRSTAFPMGLPRPSVVSQSIEVSRDPPAPSSSSQSADSESMYWTSMSSPDTQWSMSVYPEAPPKNTVSYADSSRASSSHPPRPVPRPAPRSTGGSFVDSQSVISPTPELPETHRSPLLQKHFANQSYPTASQRPGHSSYEPESRKKHTTCSHCGSTRAADGLEEYNSDFSSTRTCASTPSRSFTRKTSTEDLNDLSSCRHILAGLARGSTEISGRESGQTSRQRRHKRSRNIREDGSPTSDQDSQDESLRKGGRHEIVEKVVILCLRNGKLEKY